MIVVWKMVLFQHRKVTTMKYTRYASWESGHCPAPIVDLTPWGLGTDALGRLSIVLASDDEEHARITFALLSMRAISEQDATALLQSIVDTRFEAPVYVSSAEVSRISGGAVEMRLFHRKLSSAEAFEEFALVVGVAFCRLIKMGSEKWFMGVKTHTIHHDASGRQVNPFKELAREYWFKSFP